LVQKKKKTLKF